jgi:hypothetical protein
MRNYWALLPAVAVCVVLALTYAVPTLVNPQFTANALGLFRRDTETETVPLDAKRRRTQRLGAIGVLVAALALVGFNVSLNREANGCHLAARAWGADGSTEYDDPCIDMIFGAFLSSPDAKVLEADPQPVRAYQVVRDEQPRYLRWIQNKPAYDKADIIVGAPSQCGGKVKFTESDDKVTIVADMSDPCPPDSKIAVVSIELSKPLGDREVVTADDTPMERIDPDMHSWPTVLKELATGG